MKNIKNIVILAVVAIVCGMALSAIEVRAQTTGGDEANGAVSNSADATSLPTGGDNDNGATSNSVDTSSLSTGGDTDNGAVSNNTSLSSFSTGGDNDNGAVSVSEPSTPSSNGGRSGSRSGGSRIAIATTTPTVLGTTTFACPLITTSMKIGWKNDAEEVAKLQAFLKNVEKLDVEVTGSFDTKTEDAVKAFQKKYVETTMGPWGATKPSGFVHITTGKMINKLACSAPLTLSADELAIIEAYKNRPAGEIEVIGSDSTVGTSTASTSDEIGSDDANVAGAAGASILSTFWNFLKNLFK